MSKNNPLLRTLIESPNPEPIAMWPQTIGWKVVSLAALCVLGYIGFKSYQSWVKNRYKREALKALNTLSECNDLIEIRIHRLNWVLKTVAAKSYSNKQVAILHGDRWASFLVNTSNAEIEERLVMRWQESLYQPGSALTNGDVEQLIAWAKLWINTHVPTPHRDVNALREVEHD